jgi:coproporphyrinogen III oxidase-like Fe-S oxidoreductase
MVTQLDDPRSIDGDVSSAELAELRRRMRRPQRHRLLHGYPLGAAMPHVERGGPSESRILRLDPRRGLLVGVLPHPFCNPSVAGCGFCTFPHEAFSRRKATVVIDSVTLELERKLRLEPSLVGRAPAGLYFGGGTANLSPPGPFRKLCRALAGAFDFSAAELTLEGVPARFLDGSPPLVDILREEIPARHYRLSMGIQTFDEDRLRQMGRLGFGNAETFRRVMRLGHDRGFTVSGDLLFNLPGQQLAAMREDVRRGVEIGLDHVGLYHLVMFDGLRTGWSRDPALLAALPTNEVAAANWLGLRSSLRDLGFYQATLTNFERRELLDHPRRFVYEELSFRPHRYDMIGLGPTGISFAGSGPAALKVINRDDATGYVAAVDRGLPAWDRAFDYTPRDLRILHLTRRLAALRIERPDYRESFGTDPLDDFPREFDALEREGLVRVSDASIEPTPLGMFFADSVAALLADNRLRHERRPICGPIEPRDDFGRNSNERGYM